MTSLITKHLIFLKHSSFLGSQQSPIPSLAAFLIRLVSHEYDALIFQHTMVQINREAVYGEHHHRFRTLVHHHQQHSSILCSLIRFIQVLLLSSAIPLIFLLRFVLHGGHVDFLSYFQFQPPDLILDLGGDDSLSTASNTAKNATKRDEGYFTVADTALEFLHNVDFSAEHALEGSDVAELYHCDLSSIEWDKFTDWALPLLTRAINGILHDPTSRYVPPDMRGELAHTMQREFSLQLLEQYASDEQMCDYSLYRPTVHWHDFEAATLKKQPNRRIIMIISAYHDISHLKRLVQSVSHKDMTIIIHLERRTSDTFRRSVQQLASNHNLAGKGIVVVVQFGTITYRTDSISLVNLRIIRWVTLDLQLEYDYAILLDGAAYPLVSANDLVETLGSAAGHRNIWLGELTHQGNRVFDSPADALLRQKRLILTAGTFPKLHKRLPRSAQSPPSVLSESIRSNMRRKSTSGNQAIYSHHVIHQLLASDEVMELFALSKYGCCCCVEERNWIAALSILGYESEALEGSMMFQLWGGTQHGQCQSSMSNALLSMNKTLCYRSEDPNHLPSVEYTASEGSYIWGYELWDQLVDARKRGFLFARKFATDHAESHEVLQKIESTLWAMPLPNVTAAA